MDQKTQTRGQSWISCRAEFCTCRTSTELVRLFYGRFPVPLILTSNIYIIFHKAHNRMKQRHVVTSVFEIFDVTTTGMAAGM